MENFKWGRLVYIFRPHTNKLKPQTNKPLYNPYSSPSKKVKDGYGKSTTGDSLRSLQFMPKNTAVFDEIQIEEIDIDRGDSYEEIDLEMIRNIWEEKVTAGAVLPTFPITLSCHIRDNG